MGVEPQLVKPHNAGVFPQGGGDVVTGVTCGLGRRRSHIVGCILGAYGCVWWGVMLSEMEDTTGLPWGRLVASMVTDFLRTLFFCVSRKRVTECAQRNQRGGAEAGMTPRLSRNWTS